MKKALLALATMALAASAFAQGTIVFANRNIPILAGGTTGGGNGNGTYNVPIWEFNGLGTKPAGLLPGGVTVGLFTSTGTQLGTTLLRTDAAPSLNAGFFATGSQTLAVPGSDAGTTPSLLVRAWQGSSFAAAQGGAGQWNEWSFTTKPLGGTPASGGLPITPPSMTGWGPESGAGLPLVPEPSTIALSVLGVGALLLRRRK